MTKYLETPLVITPPAPTIPKFVRGSLSYVAEADAPHPFSQGDGTSFTTSKPFTVEDYAIGRNLDLTTAQAVLDQAVEDGDVVVVV